MPALSPIKKRLALLSFVLAGVLLCLFQVKADVYPFFTRTLSLTSQGTEVTALQRFLNTQKPLSQHEALDPLGAKQDILDLKQRPP